MKTETFHIDGPVLLTATVHRDRRGAFSESYNAARFHEALGFTPDFVQDNLSVSEDTGTLRGLHLQTPPAAQAKLVSCVKGKILDVAVDVRKGSSTYGEHISVSLSGHDGQSLWIPEGFLHGFITRTPGTIISYKVTAHYSRDCDVSVIWNDPDLAIDWEPGETAPILSNKDANALKFSTFETPFAVAS